ncbi:MULTISPECIES: hypothetical protein [unclassified Neorhizobium]|uniref:hypothetical protein n=1 Tax=unclassified Neorhizobium TaxID=2629175 RepID=UPI001FF414EE|nr:MULTISPECIES: hypothetical protein [unclassified Neorhizobium]MCJ9669038.1 hypothetical protein [Neorhizobium sp. SHOUNA12B]MCJ9744992.1 hypothetical protein [Neorhizobium sp. SHOUNA12A]
MDYISGELANIKQNGIGIKIDTHPCTACGQVLMRHMGKRAAAFGGMRQFPVRSGKSDTRVSAV